jgi:dTDP-4-amino-4,6-dideoxygalactose transaminase
MIRLAAPEIDDDDQRAVAEVLASGWLSGGPAIAAFERAVAERSGVAHGVAVSSGTTALTLALQALGVGPGDEVIVPSFSYIATAHAVALAGATPRIVDVERTSWNIAPDAAAAQIGPRTRALIAVDQFGLLAELEPLREACGTIPIVEDAACALGATDALGRRCGQPPARLTCLSFHPRKAITCGEGGMVLTDDDTLALQLRQLRSHGRDDAGRFCGLGGNHRLSAPAAALGLSQLRRLDRFIATRKRLAARYRRGLEPLLASGQLALQGATAGHAYQTFAAALEGPPDPARRDALIAALRVRGVESGIATTAAHQHPPYAAEHRADSLPIAEWLACNGFALPLHMTLEDNDVDRVCDALDASLGALPSARAADDGSP